MKREVKRVDFALQKGIMDCGQAITPLAKALELLQSNKDPETAKGYVMNAFKILSLNIEATNLKRLNLIKRELKPKYRDLCPEEPSATKLLGDNFQEAVKNLDGTKGHITLTSQNFLGKRGGATGTSRPSTTTTTTTTEEITTKTIRATSTKTKVPNPTSTTTGITTKQRTNSQQGNRCCRYRLQKSIYSATISPTLCKTRH